MTRHLPARVSTVLRLSPLLFAAPLVAGCAAGPPPPMPWWPAPPDQSAMFAPEPTVPFPSPSIDHAPTPLGSPGNQPSDAPSTPVTPAQPATTPLASTGPNSPAATPPTAPTPGSQPPATATTPTPSPTSPAKPAQPQMQANIEKRSATCGYWRFGCGILWP